MLKKGDRVTFVGVGGVYRVTMILEGFVLLQRQCFRRIYDPFGELVGKRKTIVNCIIDSNSKPERLYFDITKQDRVVLNLKDEELYSDDFVNFIFFPDTHKNKFLYKKLVHCHIIEVNSHTVGLDYKITDIGTSNNDIAEG
ncbi:MAG: hypothetical protein LBL00_08820 [Endomicrobium sp.]|jgi:hypothetical protein|nr:hypothetical protein [Endomicrobium sp.]